MVRVRLKRSGRELLQQPAGGIAVGPHAALFNHDIAFFIKLALTG